ncbi:MAG: flagellar hook-length control protein FliK [Lachnospiraceae bacterium]
MESTISSMQMPVIPSKLEATNLHKSEKKGQEFQELFYQQDEERKKRVPFSAELLEGMLQNGHRDSRNMELLNPELQPQALQGILSQDGTLITGLQASTVGTTISETQSIVSEIQDTNIQSVIMGIADQTVKKQSGLEAMQQVTMAPELGTQQATAAVKESVALVDALKKTFLIKEPISQGVSEGHAVEQVIQEPAQMEKGRQPAIESMSSRETQEGTAQTSKVLQNTSEIQGKESPQILQQNLRAAQTSQVELKQLENSPIQVQRGELTKEASGVELTQTEQKKSNLKAEVQTIDATTVDSKTAANAATILPKEPMLEVNEATTKDVIPVKVNVPEEIPQKVLEHLLTKASNKEQFFEVQLEPLNLGKIAIKIAYEQNSTTVSIVCSNAKTTELLAQSARELGSIMEQNLGSPTAIYVEKSEENYLNQEHGEHQNQEQEQQNKSNQSKKEQQDIGIDFIQQLRLGLVAGMETEG